MGSGTTGPTQRPLVTLDFADLGRNHSNKELVQRVGPVLMGYYTVHEAVFVLNSRYINREPEEYTGTVPAGRSSRDCLNGLCNSAGGLRVPGLWSPGD